MSLPLKVLRGLGFRGLGILGVWGFQKPCCSRYLRSPCLGSRCSRYPCEVLGEPLSHSKIPGLGMMRMNVTMSPRTDQVVSAQEYAKMLQSMSVRVARQTQKVPKPSSSMARATQFRSRFIIKLSHSIPESSVYNYAIIYTPSPIQSTKIP